MKKLVLPMVGLAIICSWGVTSCSKGQEAPIAQVAMQAEGLTTTEAQSLSNLERTLDSYNAIYRAQPQAQNARSFWSFLKKIVTVVATDALGSVVGNAAGGPIGGIALGVASSIEMATNTPDWSTSTESSTSAFCPMDSANTCVPIDVNDPSVDKDNTEIGELHNEIIQNLYRKYPNIEKMSKEELYAKVLEEVKANKTVAASKWTTSAPAEDVTSNAGQTAKIVQACNAISAQPSVNPTTSLTGVIQQTTGLSSTEARILSNYATTVASIEKAETVKSYAEGFNQTVASAPVSKTFKRVTQVFTSVAANSKVLWVPKK